jgi:hypothetical protein
MSTENTTENTDNVEVNDIKVDGELFWEGLDQEQAHVTKNILAQQALVLELSKKFEHILKKDQNTFRAVDGLMKSIHDIAIGVSQLQAQHKIDGVYRVGVVVGDDEILDYLRIGAGYVVAEENLANMIATAYLDIFTKLTTADAGAVGDLSELEELTKGNPIMSGTPDA